MRWSFVFCLFLFRIFFSFWSTGVHDRWICQIVFANFQKKTNKKNKNKNLMDPGVVDLKWSDFLLFFFWNVVTVISSLLFPSIIDVHLEFGTIHVEQRKKNSNFFWKRTLPRPKVKKKRTKRKRRIKNNNNNNNNKKNRWRTSLFWTTVTSVWRTSTSSLSSNVVTSQRRRRRRRPTGFEFVRFVLFFLLTFFLKNQFF